MIQGLRTATIFSEDLNNLLPFYRDTLGLSVSIETPAFVLLGDPQEASIGLTTPGAGVGDEGGDDAIYTPEHVVGERFEFASR